MYQDIKKLFLQIRKKEFTKLLETLKNKNDTIFLFPNTDHYYFYYKDIDITLSLLKLHKLQWEIDNVYRTFSDFAQRQIIQSFLIDEIESTNSI
jgi:hypothetical protein